MAMDGWSNVQHDPTLGFSLAVEGKRYFVDLLETWEEHSIENLVPLLENKITEHESSFSCKIQTFVVDNAFNMAGARRDL